MISSKNNERCPWLYQTLKETLPLALFIVDSDLKIIDYNNKALKILALSSEEIKNISLEKFFPEKKEILLESINTGLPIEEIKMHIINKQGEEIPVFIYAFPIREKNILTGLILYILDAREARHYEFQKRYFLSMLAHDFKAPLMITLGLIHRLLEEKPGPLTPKQREYLETISQELHHMESLVLSFLEMLSLETGHLKLHLAPIEVKSFLEEISEKFRWNAEKRHIGIKLELPAKEISLIADRLQLERALFNLLDNALKYSPDNSEIEIRAYQKGDEVYIEVEDHGPGIAPKELSKIFEPFYRSKKEKKGGTGLGLSIVKGIIKAHGGEILVESQEGKGSKFIIKIGKKCPLKITKK